MVGLVPPVPYLIDDRLQASHYVVLRLEIVDVIDKAPARGAPGLIDGQVHQDLATHDLRGSVGANAVRSPSLSPSPLHVIREVRNVFGRQWSGEHRRPNSWAYSCPYAALPARRAPQPNCLALGHLEARALQLRWGYSLDEDDLCTNIAATMPAADRDGGNRHVRYPKRFVLLLVIAYSARQLQLVVWQQAQRRGTDLRLPAFQAGHIPSWCESCESYGLSPVAGGSRWLLLLLSSARHVRAWPPSPPGRCPCSPPLPPIGLTAADLFAGGEVSSADSRVRSPGTLTCARCPAVRSAFDAGPKAYHNPAAVWWGAFAASAVIRDQVVTITPGVRALPGKRGLGCPQAGPRRAARLRVRGDNTGGAAPWDRGPGREPRRERVSRNTDRPSAFQAGHIPSCCMTCERPWVLPPAEGWRWLLLLLSPLLSVAVPVTVTVQRMARGHPAFSWSVIRRCERSRAGGGLGRPGRCGGGGW